MMSTSTISKRPPQTFGNCQRNKYTMRNSKSSHIDSKTIKVNIMLFLLTQETDTLIHLISKAKIPLPIQLLNLLQKQKYWVFNKLPNLKQTVARTLLVLTQPDNKETSQILSVPPAFRIINNNILFKLWEITLLHLRNKIQLLIVGK